jgi:hypothetical protein
MQLARFVGTLGLLLMLTLVGFGGGCGQGSSGPAEQQEENKAIREYHKGVHQQLKQDAKQLQQDIKQQRASKRAAHRGPTGG